MTQPALSRSLGLAGASNFRDLGGYVARDGRTVRWRRLFRSDHLAGLTAQDAARLARIGLARAFDFRGVNERAATPYELPGVAQHTLPIEPTVVQSLQAIVAAGRRLTAHEAMAVMEETYRWFVHHNAHRFAELFRHLLEHDAPLVFHCTAGKDRTGFAAALLLLALGVPRELVMQDYLLTNEVFEQPPFGPDDPMAEARAVLWRVRQDFLDSALQAVDDDHGGIERYLGQRLGLSRTALDELAQRYLQRA